MKNSKNTVVIQSIFDKVTEMLYSCLYVVGGDTKTNPAYITALKIISGAGRNLAEIEDVSLFENNWNKFKNDLLKNAKCTTKEICEYGPILKDGGFVSFIQASCGKDIDDFHQNILPRLLNQMNTEKNDFRNYHLNTNRNEALGRSGQGLSHYLFLE